MNTYSGRLSFYWLGWGFGIPFLPFVYTNGLLAKIVQLVLLSLPGALGFLLVRLSFLGFVIAWAVLIAHYTQLYNSQFLHLDLLGFSTVHRQLKRCFFSVCSLFALSSIAFSLLLRSRFVVDFSEFARSSLPFFSSFVRASFPKKKQKSRPNGQPLICSFL